MNKRVTNSKIVELRKDLNKFKNLLKKYYVDQDLTAKETGKKLDISYFYVRNYLIKFKIKRRNKGHRKGERSKHWKGGRRKHNGYIYIWRKDHPRNSNHYVGEHILIMEKHIGRYLKLNEVVHHKNRKRDDNRIENLELCSSHGEHLKKHWKIRKEPQTKRVN
jgi:hypothetical protein